MYDLHSYFYTLPDWLIAQEAMHPAHDARLMIVDRDRGDLIAEDTFWSLDKYLPQDRILFFNNSRVLPARIRLKEKWIEHIDGKREIITNGEILFCQKHMDGIFEALVRPGKKFKIGTKIYFEKGYLEVTGISRDGRYLRAYDTSIQEIMEKEGELPLPPYISYDKTKESSYQTVFAKEDGSVAAPTASLHFTEALLSKLPHEKEYVTLHVGLGTFKGVDTPDIRDYHIHEELAEIPLDLFRTIARYKTAQKGIVAVGTTVCRTLESLPSLWQSISTTNDIDFDDETRTYWDNLTESKKYVSHIHIHDGKVFFETSIFIYPGYAFQIIDDLITNFHLPESSLLMLVSAFLGKESTMNIYRYAVEHSYRFFSFGDGMYIRKSSQT